MRKSLANGLDLAEIFTCAKTRALFYTEIQIIFGTVSEGLKLLWLYKEHVVEHLFPAS